ncbi:NAD(P)-dependent oxidoreductase [Nocardia amamiensis]|uniref:NAD(P)-dependent oxidoreductase n=1 Tax=Nocardia amamiensis TaxID=404578 RepID=UPI0008301FFF|nr:NAD(P)-dependent oxidoreductase [Nocardia amamiensis]
MTCLHIPRSIRIQREQRRANDAPATEGELHRRMLKGATLDSPDVLVVDNGHLKATWPFLGDRLRNGLVSRDFTVMWESLPAGRSLREIEGIAEAPALVLLDVEPGAEDIAAMPRLGVVAGVTGTGPAVAPQLAARGIPYVDGSRGHSYSRAEMAVALTLSALRQLPGWHVKVAVEGPAAWPLPSWQFSDHLGYVSGTLRGKHVVVAGLDPVGMHVADLCSAFGAVVSVADPAAEDIDFTVCDVQRVGIDEIPQTGDILVVASSGPELRVPAGVVNRMTPGSLVVTIDGAGIDLAAVRARVLHDELAWATDVYETTPVALDDPILGRDNVIHTPAVAGRTRDANHGVADVLAENVIRVLRGGQPWPWDCIPAARSAAERTDSAGPPEVGAVSLTNIVPGIEAGRW